MAISPSSPSTKEQSPQSDHQGSNGRAVDQGSDADHDHDHDHDHPGRDAAPESMKDGHGESTQQMTGPGTEIGIGIGISIEIPIGTPAAEDTEIAPNATETPLRRVNA
ncbi:hypothetical protein PCASD_00795 [Puccinia coronata f. sp. avenae]|uniref:Uncharacterized protein n=1 Tax=Puccinia coronata f. sp. avenae TaxID=200324 RepID=A0A2N5VPG2_9BASI|nr:hypothetical protein PCASD_00795 [Puccinia coronata f. sp. avenae]